METTLHNGLEFRVTRFDGGPNFRFDRDPCDWLARSPKPHHDINSKKPFLVLLHGFLGSGEQFSHLMPELRKTCRPVTVDILPAKYSETRKGMDAVAWMDMTARLDTDSLVAGLRETLGRIRAGSSAPLVLLGYSMGGRLALSLATRHPGEVDGLILESTTTGITDPDQRNERRASDLRNADLIRQDFAMFLEEWDRNSLFRTGTPAESHPKSHVDLNPNPESQPDQHPELQPHPPGTGKADPKDRSKPDDRDHPGDRIRRIQRNQDPRIMAKWLEEFGTGVMPPVWEQLERIRVPVLLITGASDPKFCDLADRMKTQLADARHVVIQGAAHRVHLDRPVEYAAALNDFLSKQIFTG